MNQPSGPDELRCGSPARRILALALLALAGALFYLATRLDWGLSPVAFVPALILLPIAAQLWLIHRLVIRDGTLAIDDHRELPLAEVELEITPLAGLRAVVAHHAGRAHALALWVGRGRAQAVASWLDQRNGHPLPRRSHQRHRLDV